MNVFVGKGFIRKEPTYRETQAGAFCACFSLAIKDAKRNPKTGEYPTYFIWCEAWGSQARFLAKYWQKDLTVLVHGKLETGKYTDKVTKHSQFYTKVIVDLLELCGRGETLENKSGEDLGRGNGLMDYAERDDEDPDIDSEYA